MTLRIATPDLVRERVRKVLELDDQRDIGVLALRAEPTWTDGTLTVLDRRVEVRPCPSSLAVRASLAEWEDQHGADRNGDLLVLLCDLSDRDLGEDVLARLSPPRVLSLEPWDAAKARFGVQRVDAAFGRDDGWIATALIEHVPVEVARALAGDSTTLTREMALDALATALLGADNMGIDAMLAAAGRADPFAELDRLDADSRAALLGALADANQPLGGVVAEVLAAGHGDELLAIGLVARAVYGHGDLDGGRAAGRLETRCGGTRIEPVVGAALAQRCEEVAGRLLETDQDRAADVLADAARFADEIEAPHPERSRLLPAGFDRRLVLAVEALDAVLSAVLAVGDGRAGGSGSAGDGSGAGRGGGADTLASALGAVPAVGDGRAGGTGRAGEGSRASRVGAASGARGTSGGAAGATGAFAALRSAVEEVADHRDSDNLSGARRYGHLEMAARLVTWLATPSAGAAATSAVSFEQAVHAYVGEGAWVDRARRRLWRGDDDDANAAVYGRVIDAVVARRRSENQHFAQLLSAWSVTPPAPDAQVPQGVVTVEAVADEVLARFGSTPVLLVVLDGCGLPSFGELADQFRDVGFREIGLKAAAGSDAVGRRLTGVAALPTVTEVSRASLLAGKIDQGNQAHERRAFEKIRPITKDGRTPILFHQAALPGPAGGSLAVDVGRALDPERGPSVVGAVVNTIDDQLKRGTFADTLRLQDLDALVPLLEAARTYGRAVVVSADHGHVLAQPDDGGTGTFAGGGSGGERWREADRAPGDTEVVLRGPRVKLGGEAGVLAPWEDDYRYGAKAGGYHGGATPEEVLVPVAAYLVAGMDRPSGWELVAEVVPLWWDLVVAGEAITDRPARPAPRKRAAKRVDESQTAMFELPAEKAPAPAATAPADPAWLDALLASEVWEVQKKVVAGRAQLPPERVRAVLATASRRGGVASFAELAAGAGMATTRLPGFLAMLSRVLNVDGYPVLEVDVPAQEVRLSSPLLAQQFQIEVEPR